MHGHGVLVFILCFFGVQVCHGTQIGQKPGSHRLILVTGVEGSGTTMMTKILSECSYCVGFNNNWRISELSVKAQQKYSDPTMTYLRDQFDRITDQLWTDSSSKPYILHNNDTRNPNMLSQRRKKAATILERTFALRKFVHNIIHHRSMPHGPTRLITPFLEDLPHLVPHGLAHVIILCRFMPASWISNSRLTDYAPFLERIERLMDGSETIPGVQLHFVSYEYLCCRPKLALEELTAQLHGINITELLASPQIAFIESILKEHDNPEYQTKLKAFTRIWEMMSTTYPEFDRFQRAGESKCQNSLSKLGFSEETVDGLLSRIHQRIENDSGI